MASKVKKSSAAKTAAPEPSPPASSPAASTNTSGSTGSGGGSKKAQRASSNVFAMFEQNQIHEFKEAFQLIDSNKDGLVDKEDLRWTFDTLGRCPNEKDLENMVYEAGRPITFTTFLALFGERVRGADSEEVLINAFKQFDKLRIGKIEVKELKHYLMKWGEPFTEEEVDLAFSEAPIEHGRLDYQAYTRLICRGKPDDDNF